MSGSDKWPPPPVWSRDEAQHFEPGQLTEVVHVVRSPREPNVFDRWAAGEFDIAPNQYEQASRINDPKRWNQ